MTEQARSKRITILSFILVFVALLGLLDATYLSLSALRGTELVCGELGDCTGVTTSEYSRIFGIPVAYLGFLYYATFFFLALTLATFKKRALIVPLFVFSTLALGASLWFVFAQVALLKLVCLYCMISAVTSATLFVLMLIVVRENGKRGAHSPLVTDSME